MDDAQAMQLALQQAQQAAQAGEVPVGAVVLRGGEVIAVGRNAPVATHDPTAHAEVVALRAAAQALGNYRLQDCELFVTLEPCAMCAGALMHARLRRVVFGAADPKTGAAGSVVDLFAQPQLNHHTQVQGGVLASDCAALLAGFFGTRRAQARQDAWPVREDALRTPEACWAALPAPPWTARYVADLPSLAGLRLHYLDDGPPQARPVWLLVSPWPACSDGQQPAWTALQALGQRVVSFDAPGFGKSDKPKREAAHQLRWHVQVAVELMQRLQAPRVVVAVPPSGLQLGLAVAFTLGPRCAGLVVLPETPPQPLAAQAQAAPFPDAGHRAGLRALGALGQQLAAFCAQPDVVAWLAPEAAGDAPPVVVACAGDAVLAGATGRAWVQAQVQSQVHGEPQRVQPPSLHGTVAFSAAPTLSTPWTSPAPTQPPGAVYPTAPPGDLASALAAAVGYFRA